MKTYLLLSLFAAVSAFADPATSTNNPTGGPAPATTAVVANSPAPTAATTPTNVASIKYVTNPVGIETQLLIRGQVEQAAHSIVQTVTDSIASDVGTNATNVNLMVITQTNITNSVNLIKSFNLVMDQLDDTAAILESMISTNNRPDTNSPATRKTQLNLPTVSVTAADFAGFGQIAQSASAILSTIVTTAQLFMKSSNINEESVFVSDQIVASYLDFPATLTNSPTNPAKGANKEGAITISVYNPDEFGAGIQSSTVLNRLDNAFRESLLVQRLFGDADAIKKYPGLTNAVGQWMDMYTNLTSTLATDIASGTNTNATITPLQALMSAETDVAPFADTNNTYYLVVHYDIGGGAGRDDFAPATGIQSLCNAGSSVYFSLYQSSGKVLKHGTRFIYTGYFPTKALMGRLVTDVDAAYAREHITNFGAPIGSGTASSYGWLPEHSTFTEKMKEAVGNAGKDAGDIWDRALHIKK